MENTGYDTIFYVGPDSIPRIKVVLSIGWLLAVGLYCYFWYLSAWKPRAGTASPFSPGQQAIQSGIVAGCRGVVLTFAVLDLAGYIGRFDPAPPPYFNTAHAAFNMSLDSAAFEASLGVGLVVAIIAALVKYATIESTK